MHFGENQLSPGSVSFSLLPTGHPRIFHDPPVRTSSGFYPTFILPMGSSPGFGSTAPDSRPIRTRFRFGSASTGLTSPGTVTPRLINQKAHRHPLGLRLLVGTQFQVSFTPLPGCFSPFPHGTGCAIGRQVVFSLGGWSPPDSRGIPRVPRYSGSQPLLRVAFRLRGSHPLRPAFPDCSATQRLRAGSA